MSMDQKRIVLVERDRQLFTRVFENRVMSADQIRAELFPKLARQNISRRLAKLLEYRFLERRVVSNLGANDFPVFSITPKALREVRERYPFRIVKELKSDSIEHDVQLVDLRKRFQAFRSVGKYYTENMLQSCEDFSCSDTFVAFVKHNTDAAIEIKKNGKSTVVGLEFEKSDKAFDRYSRKLFSYYSDFRTAVIFYVCVNPAIKKLVARAEASVMGSNRPRCFYALLEDVLKSDRSCTFTNLKGGTITLD